MNTPILPPPHDEHPTDQLPPSMASALPPDRRHAVAVLRALADDIESGRVHGTYVIEITRRWVADESTAAIVSERTTTPP